MKDSPKEPPVSDVSSDSLIKPPSGLSSANSLLPPEQGNDNHYKEVLERMENLEKQYSLQLQELEKRYSLQAQKLKEQSDAKIKTLQQKSKSKIEGLERRLCETENRVGISSITSLVPWRRIIKGNPAAPAINDKSDKFKLPADMYSIIASWNWNSRPFWASTLIILMQFTLLTMLIVDLLGAGSSDNELGLPGNVEVTVRIAQFVAIPIAVFKQEDLRIGIEGLSQGLPETFRGDVRFEHMNAFKWRVGYFLRFAQGFVSMFASFFLLVQADTVFDLLLNFLGIEFIADLDKPSISIGRAWVFWDHDKKVCPHDFRGRVPP